jgi:hypothetical protein
VLSRDLQLQREIFGSPLKVLIGAGTILFYNSQVHFAPTHMVELSVYDPARQRERKIYPPAQADTVRQEFVRRVQTAYASRGEAWFRQNNHHMDPERFDSDLMTSVVEDGGRSVAFLVQYRNPINDAGDPLASQATVVVTCTAMDQVERSACKERPLSMWTEALKLSVSFGPGSPSESAQELLRRAASNPGIVP